MTSESYEKAKEIKQEIETLNKIVNYMENVNSFKIDSKEIELDGGYTRYNTCAFTIAGIEKEVIVRALKELIVSKEKEFADL